MSLFFLGRSPRPRYTALDTLDKEVETQEVTPSHRRNPFFHYALFALLLSSLSLNVILWNRRPVSASVAPSGQLLFSPAQDVIEYQTQKFTRGLADDIPIYERPPSHEVDEAWRQLTQYASTMVPASVAVQMPNKTWSVPEHEGYFLTSLDVFHQLHCLDMIRQTIHHDDYPDLHLSLIHLRHCIGAIRQALMCFSDVTPIVWQWNETLGMGDQRDDIQHTCRNFDRVQEWAKDHYYDNIPNLAHHVEWALDA